MTGKDLKEATTICILKTAQKTDNGHFNERHLGDLSNFPLKMATGDYNDLVTVNAANVVYM